MISKVIDVSYYQKDIDYDAGLACVAASLCIAETILSAIIGVTGASLLWSIGELFEQKKRVERGWFPMNPKRKDQYSNGKNVAHSKDQP